jgi:hypothetical protein
MEQVLQFSDDHFYHSLMLLGAGPFSRDQVMIEMVSADILLNIFYHYLYAAPKIWPTLTHVCRSWRQIVLGYPLALDLRLYCTYGIPVQKILECWPSFPLVVKYGGFPKLDPPALEDDDNIVASLKQSGRVSSISLTVTSSLLEKLPAITEPLSGLEELVLLSRDNTQLTLPSAFRWGSHLRTLHSTRVAIPSLPQLLAPCQDLTDLRLHEISIAGYFPPEEFANALSGVTHLRTLSLRFLSFPSHRRYLALSLPSAERVVHPALTCFEYRGTSKYLDSFVARIDAPRLGDIDITLFSQPTMDASQLGRFIGRIEILTPLSRADVQIFSANAIHVTFSNESNATPLRLRIPCEQLDRQLSSMAQIFNQFSPFLFRVEDLRISSTQSPHVEDGMAREQWLEPIRAFRGTKDLHVGGVHVTDILGALRPADGGHTAVTGVLPALRNLHLKERMSVDMPLWDAAESFLASWQLSGRPVELYADASCHICNAWFPQQQKLRRHLADKHIVHLPPPAMPAQGNIRKFSDDILLTLFRYYLDASPRFWPRLVHICRKWRNIVIASCQSLRLRLFFTPGTPVLNSLRCWPALPIVIQYGGSPVSYPPAPEDEDNIVAALDQFDRVRSISLTITKPLLAKLSAIQRRFSKLENLVLLCSDDVLLTPSSDFRWESRESRLRTLHLTRIAIPSLSQLLVLSTGLVDLRLHEISNLGYISPETFADAMSRMSHLRTLSLHFLSSTSCPNYTGLPPNPSDRVILPALTDLEYRGSSKYLDSLAAKIDAPLLGNINLTFFSQPPHLPSLMEPSQLRQFIERIAMQKSHRRADILFSENAISISLTQPGSPTCLELQVSCNSYSLRLLEDMTRICNGLYSFLFRIEHLCIRATRPTSGHDYNDPECREWQNILSLFRGTNCVYVACGHSTNTIVALQRSRHRPRLLPALHKLCIQEPDPRPDPPLQEAVESFIHSRLLSGHIIAVEYE